MLLIDLPDDIIQEEIYSRLSIRWKYKFGLTYSNILPIWNHTLGKIIKIQREYRQYRNFYKEMEDIFYKKNNKFDIIGYSIPENDFKKWINNSKFCKKVIIRKYIATYPIHHLLTYPEFVARKCYSYPPHLDLASQEPYPSLRNLPETNKRTIRNIKNFLEKIPLVAIFYAGW